MKNIFLSFMSLAMLLPMLSLFNRTGEKCNSLPEGRVERRTGKDPGGLETLFYRPAQSARWGTQCTGHYAG